MELVEEVGDEAVDVLASVVGVEGLDGEGEGGDEGFEARDEEVLGDAGYGAKVLELRDFVDDVDEADALLAAAVAEVDGVDAKEAGLAIGPGLALVAGPESCPKASSISASRAASRGV